MSNLVQRARAVRIPSRVTEIDEVLVGEQIDKRAGHSESAEPAVEDPNRTILHGPIVVTNLVVPDDRYAPI